MSSPAVAIVDSGGANIASLLFAFERLGIAATLTADARQIEAADRVLLPGVGAARDSMQRLRQLGLVETIRGLTQPVLGICLGMQLLAEASDEDNAECLGVIPATARRLSASPLCPVPNMGWCRTGFGSGDTLLSGIDDGAYFYYLHSYALPVGDYTLATANHGERFSAIVRHENFVAAQFHPERSAAAGARLLRNFVSGGA
ncbi:MAG: imidazole glycerol phosphate synthase subunit HisH [Pseudomonadota bacterium]